MKADQKIKQITGWKIHPPQLIAILPILTILWKLARLTLPPHPTPPTVPSHPTPPHKKWNQSCLSKNRPYWDLPGQHDTYRYAYTHAYIYIYIYMWNTCLFKILHRFSNQFHDLCTIYQMQCTLDISQPLMLRDYLQQTIHCRPWRRLLVHLLGS